MYNFAALLFLALSVIGIPTVAADLIGSVAKAPPAEAEVEVNRRLQQQDLCSCSPRSYTFQFNFSQTCPPISVNPDDRPGVADATCLISPFGNPEVQDLIPIQIDSIDILELDPDLQVVSQENIVGPFFDGDTIGYTSVSTQLDPDEQLADQEEGLPRGIQLNIIGVNAADQPIINVFLVTYDITDCEGEPFVLGDTIGWTEVVDFTSAAAVFCPAIETEPPTSIPSLSPTTSEPTTEQPTTGQPTTEQPTPIPTWPPTPKPTPIPTTDSPTPKPTPSPVAGSMSYSASFSLSHMSKASKGKATKSGKSKSEKLIRGRS